MLITLVNQSCQPVSNPPEIVPLVDVYLVDRPDAELRNRVQTIQVWQVATLRELIQQPGLMRVSLGGLHQDNLEFVRRTVAELLCISMRKLHERLLQTEDNTKRVALMLTIKEAQDQQRPSRLSAHR